MQTDIIRRRFVFLGGYYPFETAEIRRKLHRDHARFCALWGLTGTVTDEPAERAWLPARIATAGPGWATDVGHMHFHWDDLIAADRQRGWPARFMLAWLVFADFILQGAFHRYVRTAWRYAAFFLYPFALLAGLCLVAWIIATGLLTIAAVPAPGGWRWLVALAILAAILPSLGQWLQIDHLLDDWIYAHRLIRDGDAAVGARLDALAQALTAETVDEILIVGHSFGAVHAIDLINRLRVLRPDGPAIRFASVGASILKIALHRRAHAFRAAIAQVAQADAVIWRDIYAVNDYMNFCDADPVRTLGLPGTPVPTLKVQFRSMVSPERYRRMERNYFRLHSQFIAANDRIAPYDYFMLMCGPLPLETVTRDRRGLLDLIDATGARIDGSARP